MPSLTIRVPKSLVEQGVFLLQDSIAKEAKDFISYHLSERDAGSLIHRVPDPVPSTNESIWLSTGNIRNIRGFFSDSIVKDLSDGECVSAFLNELARKAKKMVAGQPKNVKSNPPFKGDRPIDRMLSACGREVRPEQELILGAFDNRQRKMNSVLFCEAGTGIGKTIAYLGAAFEMIEKNPSAHIVIALPTNALINQIRPDVDSFLTVAKGDVSVRYIRPQKDWMSESALRAFVDLKSDMDSNEAKRIIEWISTGKDQPEDWLMSRFNEAFPDFVFSEILGVDQRVSDDDMGLAAYRSQFTKESTANLTIMTHAMLATLTRIHLRKRMRLMAGDPTIAQIKAQWLEEKEKKVGTNERIDRLYTRVNAYLSQFELPEESSYYIPILDHLIIDEAHKFEDAMASAFSQTISIRQLVEQIDKIGKEFPGSLSVGAIDDLRAFSYELMKMLADSPEEFIETNVDVIDALAKRVNAAIKINAKTSDANKKKIHQTPVYRRAMLIVKAIEADLLFYKFGGAISVFIGSSPVKGYPQITVGQPQLGRPFDHLYRVMTQQTTMMSGTLYTGFPPIAEGSRIALGVQKDLKIEMAPIESKWQVDPVTLQMVTKVADASGRQRFNRPRKSKLDENEYDRLYPLWIDDVSRYTLGVFESSAGGVLVLASSFKDVDLVAGYLAREGLRDYLIVQKRGMSVHTLRDQFISESRMDNAKPIMIATGAAWTGLDIHDASQENLLTDLVILNAPFGLKDKNASSLRRLTGKNKFVEIAHNATVLVKQSVGRLVRSPNTLPNRRLHWLDGRIHDTERGGLFSSIKSFLKRYRRVDVA